jgi:hypothetical protein
MSESEEAADVKASATSDQSDDRPEPKAALTSVAPGQKENLLELGPVGETGPETHEKTECDCGKEGHYEKLVCDEVVKAPLGKVWNCVFGDGKDFISSFLRDNQKLLGNHLFLWRVLTM